MPGLQGSQALQPAAAHAARRAAVIQTASQHGLVLDPDAPDARLRMRQALVAFKEQSQLRQLRIAEAVQRHGPVWTWTAATIREHDLGPLLPHVHIDLVRQGEFDKAAAVARHKELFSPHARDTRITMWHWVRDKALKIGRAVTATAAGVKAFAKEHPAKAAGLGLGAVGVFAVAFWAAPALSAVAAKWLLPVLGKTGAAIAGTATGGALTSGTRSLVVHSAPMVIGVDPVNARQLATDVSMSTGFGFLGFAQAKMVTGLTRALRLPGVASMGVTAVLLVGWEVLKDYIQNHARNKVSATAPKCWTDSVDPVTGKQQRGICSESVVMETATNISRCIPGLEASFVVKALADVTGTVWWDRILNKRGNAAPASSTVADVGAPR